MSADDNTGDGDIASRVIVGVDVSDDEDEEEVDEDVDVAEEAHELDGGSLRLGSRRAEKSGEDDDDDDGATAKGGEEEEEEEEGEEEEVVKVEEHVVEALLALEPAPSYLKTRRRNLVTSSNAALFTVCPIFGYIVNSTGVPASFMQATVFFAASRTTTLSIVPWPTNTGVLTLSDAQM